MIKRKTFDYSSKSLDFGFEYYPSHNTDITLDDFSDMTKKSLFIYDTGNCVFNELMRKNYDLVNDEQRLFIGLVSDVVLQNLQKTGVRTGMYRSTNVRSNCAVIVVDKAKAYIAMDANHIYEVLTEYSKDIFQYLNHIFWAQTQYEYFGNYSKVEDIRLSVLEPDLSSLMVNNMNSTKYGTEDFQSDNLMVFSEQFTKAKAFLLACPMPKAFSKNGRDLNVNAFGEIYLPVKLEEQTLFRGESFHNKKMRDLINKKIWFNGKQCEVQSEKTITESVYLTLDEMDNFTPDFEKVANRNTDLVCTLNVEIDVQNIVLNDSFKRHPNYQEKAKAEDALNNAIQKIENLKIDGIEKQLLTIKNAKVLDEKIGLFNNLLKKEDGKIGDKVLNKKENAISPIVVSQEKIAVPSNVLGDLYVKDGKTYFAVDSASDYKQGKQWLHDHKMEGSVILKNA